MDSRFSESAVKDAEQFEKPILYLHGDGHRWIHDRPGAAKNILRVQVDQGGIAKITVTDHYSDHNYPLFSPAMALSNCHAR